MDERLALGLAVGDVVVYASHGIGRIASTHEAEGTQPARIVIFLESGLRVTLPLVRAREALRCLSGEPELEDVRLTLRADVAPSARPWPQRRRFVQEKLTAGEIGGLAEIVRDGLQRERRLTTASNRRSQEGRSQTSTSDRPAGCWLPRSPHLAGSSRRRRTPGSCSRSP